MKTKVELIKTSAFALAGVALVGCATLVYFYSQPKKFDEFELVGELFYPEFDSPTAAQYLKLAAYDEDKGAQEFRVEKIDDICG